MALSWPGPDRFARQRVWLLAALITTILSASLASAGVVGTGTAASCTQAALETQIAAGGTVTFNCGAAAVIPVGGLYFGGTNPTTIVDGGGNITLDGGSTGGIVTISCSAGSPGSLPDVTFRNIAFRNGKVTTGYYSGGAILSLGKLTLDTVTFTLNSALSGGGAIYQTGGIGCPLPSTTIWHSTFTSNQTGGVGGAIDVVDGTVTINDSEFSSNTAEIAGGAISLGYSLGASRSLSISNGHFSGNQTLGGSGGAIGGATSGTGTISIDSSTFTQNECSGATFSGGAVFADETDLTIAGSLFRSNSSTAGWAGAVSAVDNTVAVSETTFDQNSSASGGAGAFMMQNVTATFRRCTFSGNTAQGGNAGGAMITNGTVGIENSTFSGNASQGASGYAGAIYVQNGTTDLRNVTLTLNRANSNGGIDVPGNSTLTMRNTILAGNTETGSPSGNPEISVNGTFTSNGYNLMGSSSGITAAGTDIINPTPNLGTLANNGGPTFTHVPNPGSPAIDAGNPAGCLALGGGSLTIDQRNMARPAPVGGRCDIGAVEVQSASTSTPRAGVMGLPVANISQVHGRS